MGVFSIVNSTDKRQSLEEIVALYKNCKDEKRKKLFHLKIIERSMELVKKIATPIAVQTGLPTEDLVQVGALGLIKAIEFYETGKNAKFETYANYFIKGEIRHYVRDKAGLIKMPRKVQELMHKINSARKTLMDETGAEPTDEMTAEFLHLPVAQIRDVLKVEQYKSLISLDQSVSSGDDDDLSLLEKIPADQYDGFGSSFEDRLTIAFVIEKLPPELRQIIELSFYQDLNQREISEKLHISQMQVSRRLKKALNKMYELIKKN